MPRLKLKRFRVRQPRPEALARYLRVYASEDLYRQPEGLPSLSARELFGRDGLLALDLGSGRGEYLVAQAQARPARLFVGIEIHWKSVWDAVNRADAAGLENVRFIRADVRRVLAKVPDESVDEVTVLFPPPALVRKRRGQDLLSEAVIEHLARVMVDGAPLRFVTDHPDFFAHKIALIRSGGCFEEVTLAQDFEGGLTRFQQFWESRAVPSLRFEAVRAPRSAR